MKEFKQKVAGEVNEAELKKKNEELKAEMQTLMEDNKKNSEEIEVKIKEKQKSSEAVQEKLKTMMQTRFEELISDSTKEKKTQIELLQKEQEMKAQIQMYESNFDQLNDSLRKSGQVFSRLKKELKKVLVFRFLKQSRKRRCRRTWRCSGQS
ncbi:MAG: TetR/AcrR family transcriptional regulator C-terminal domain-containing protein [Candidatus Pacebacteria bacterium]|nr:TetR/AcrR family transcriptional regulator C-terminal domain-containing protein [Candidatus Paceibacterota bacterium]